MKQTERRGIAAALAMLLVVFALALHGDPAEIEDTDGAVENGGDPQTAITVIGADAASSEAVSLPADDLYTPFVEGFSPATVPDYSGAPYVKINGSVPFFTASDVTAEAFERYSELDALGRCGAAYASVVQELMPTEPRGQIGAVRPSGWHTTRYDDLIADHYLYNRCHLLAYQLTGENANPQNLITGTRYLNVEGMQPFENRVAAYINRTGNHVLYRVTPLFAGDELVARGVLMEAYSVEDGGVGVCFNVYVYNMQPGVVIDYATGESKRGETPTEQGASEISGYIGNVRSLVYHLPSCPNLPKRQNWITFETEEEAIAQGYTPCGNCLGHRAAALAEENAA